MSQKVVVVKADADGIRAKIYGKDYAWNKAKNQFYIRSNGKWTAAEIPAFHQSVLKDRYSYALMTQRHVTGQRQSFVTAEHRTYLASKTWSNDGNELYGSRYFDGKKGRSVRDDRNWGEC